MIGVGMVIFTGVTVPPAQFILLGAALDDRTPIVAAGVFDVVSTRRELRQGLAYLGVAAAVTRHPDLYIGGENADVGFAAATNLVPNVGAIAHREINLDHLSRLLVLELVYHYANARRKWQTPHGNG